MLTVRFLHQIPCPRTEPGAPTCQADVLTTTLPFQFAYIWPVNYKWFDELPANDYSMEQPTTISPHFSHNFQGKYPPGMPAARVNTWSQKASYTVC